MDKTIRTIQKNKSIALIAHDNLKSELIQWVKTNEICLSHHNLYATGTTGSYIEQATELNIHKLISGPLGGDQQVGALIAEQKLDMMIFFWDPLNAAAHDPDVKALLRLAAVWNIPIATNQVTADFIIHSALFHEEVIISIPDYESYMIKRGIS
ncbi:methylglyoxal synthase [Thorsellia anophelis]|uniref:Methylglyoxal synthase n=1 Tax=Thorsellia anophelis DSM 18579 TaxID=1123402 RepID=A0A1I0CMD7_9GAMM|nr:methylglyoxal synthase [Thorsellia anophelis]SET20809.1 methylglyoxal synthase [Thorsellia anophelis DSM 18579]